MASWRNEYDSVRSILDAVGRERDIGIQPRRKKDGEETKDANGKIPRDYERWNFHKTYCSRLVRRLSAVRAGLRENLKAAGARIGG